MFCFVKYFSFLSCILAWHLYDLNLFGHWFCCIVPDLGQFFDDHEQRREPHPGQVHNTTDKAQCHKAPAAADAECAKAKPHTQPAPKAGLPPRQEVRHRAVTHTVA